MIKYVDFEDKVKLNKLQDLNKLHKLQLMYCGFVDINIETRKDLELTAVSFCDYTEAFGTKSELAMYKLEWNKNNSDKLLEIENRLETMSKTYGKWKFEN